MQRQSALQCRRESLLYTSARSLAGHTALMMVVLLTVWQGGQSLYSLDADDSGATSATELSATSASGHGGVIGGGGGLAGGVTAGGATGGAGAGGGGLMMRFDDHSCGGNYLATAATPADGVMDFDAYAGSMMLGGRPASTSSLSPRWTPWLNAAAMQPADAARFTSLASGSGSQPHHHRHSSFVAPAPTMAASFLSMDE